MYIKPTWHRPEDGNDTNDYSTNFSNLTSVGCMLLKAKVKSSLFSTIGVLLHHTCTLCTRMAIALAQGWIVMISGAHGPHSLSIQQHSTAQRYESNGRLQQAFFYGQVACFSLAIQPYPSAYLNSYSPLAGHPHLHPSPSSVSVVSASTDIWHQFIALWHLAVNGQL